MKRRQVTPRLTYFFWREQSLHFFFFDSVLFSKERAHRKHSPVRLCWINPHGGGTMTQKTIAELKKQVATLQNSILAMEGKRVDVKSDSEDKAMALAEKALKAKMKLAVGVYTGKIKRAGTTKNGNPVFKLEKANGKWSKQLLNANGKLQWKKGWSNTKR